ncbi:MAG: hypothetical protein AB7T01_02020 [Acidithiobacillus sp.]
MSKPPMNLNLPCPIVLRNPLPHLKSVKNRVWGLTSISDLCAQSGVRLRVEDPDAYSYRVLITDCLPTSKGWTEDNRKILVISQADLPQDYPALRALELLAYAFFDYDARECLCFQDYFDRTDCLPSTG